MPLYDCMLLLKPHADKTSLMEIATRFGRHVYNRNGILTDVKCFEKTCLGYGIKKLNGRYCQFSRCSIYNVDEDDENDDCDEEHEAEEIK